MKQQQPLDLKNYSFLYDFGIKHFLLVNTIIRNSRDQNICLVPSPKYSIDKTRPSSPSPSTMATLVSSHTMSQLHQSSATLTCSVCDRVKRILKKRVHSVEWCCWETPQLVLHQQCSTTNTPHTHPRLCRTIIVVIWHHNTCQLMDFYIFQSMASTLFVLFHAPGRIANNMKKQLDEDYCKRTDTSYSNIIVMPNGWTINRTAMNFNVISS